VLVPKLDDYQRTGDRQMIKNFRGPMSKGLLKLCSAIMTLVLSMLALWPNAGMAIPLFNRQTGQNCVACHAGGQFPELTPYGRLFKLTGYTIGQRTSLPLSAMVVASMSKVANTSKSDAPYADFDKNGRPILATASAFLGGRITDNIGAFTQVTFDPYANQSSDGQYHSRTNVDNVDLRYADRFIDQNRDLIFGVSLNNNPSVSDPWNTAPAWMQYVPVPSPTSSQFIDGATPYPGYAAGGNIVGLTAYAYWNQTLYGELGGYRTARGLMSVMRMGLDDASVTQLRGINPYWRLAWTPQRGAHNLMIGTAGMLCRYYDSPLDTSDVGTVHHVKDWNIDAQFVYAHSGHRYPDSLANQPAPGGFYDATGTNPVANTNAVDTSNLLRAKLTYVYRAQYGGSLALFNLKGTTNTANQTSGYDPTLGITTDPNASAPSTRVGGNLTGSPDTRGQTYEVFMMPIQYARVGLQYTAYDKYNGAARNYDGFGRNARDNNTWFLYVWAAY
jgi:hypothetical protein